LLPFAGDPVVLGGMLGMDGGVAPYGEDEKGGFPYDPGIAWFDDMVLLCVVYLFGQAKE
jgi:hypothetical protein